MGDFRVDIEDPPARRSEPGTWQRAALVGAIGTIAVACSGAPAPDDADGAGPDAHDDLSIPDPPAPAPLPACAPALEAAATPARVAPLGLSRVTATGGTGAYVFTLVADGSGAQVHAATGAYLAGPRAQTTDRVRVTDAGCAGAAEAPIEVLPALTVSPRAAQVGPGARLAVSVSGGSGEVACALVADATGGAVDGCTYEAGTTTGRDILRVTDRVTGERLDVQLDVDAEHGLRVVGGRGGLIVPLGSRFAVTAHGGSGTLTLEVRDGGLTVDGATLVGDTAGVGTVRVRDVHTDEVADVPVQVVAPLLPSAPRDGERSGTGTALALGDKDGDGWPDAALGTIEGSVAAHYGGAVAIYAGGSSGLAPTPVQVFAGTGEQDTLGRAVALADVDDDGEPDLLIGVDKADRGATNNGELRIHRGLPGGWFEDEASTVLRGEIAYERVGTAVAACDFDADGFVDLAVGAEDATDRAVGVPAEDQGAVYVYRGAPDGFAERPDLVLYGVIPDGTGWQGAAGVGIGGSVAAGDLDGDGLCDLVAGGIEGSLHPRGQQDGVVLVWRGTDADGLLLTRTPVRVIAAPEDDDGELGRQLVVEDLDGDGADELVVTHWRAGTAASLGGAVRVYRDLLDDSPAHVPWGPDEAWWRVAGTGASDYLGSAVAVGDVDRDGEPDLVVGAYRAEDDRYGQGLVYVYTDIARQVALPFRHDATHDTPDLVWGGAERYDRFGQAVDILGDLDGDGIAELLVLAGYASVYGEEVGAPYIAHGDGALALLDLPGQAAGHDAGRSATLVDVDGDGDEDVVVGAPSAGDPEVGANAGVVEAYRWDGGLDGGMSMLGRHADHGGSDRFGWQTVAVGDVDGDGWDDLGVVARSDSRPSSYDDSYTGGGACEGYRASAGAVRVYRGGPQGIAETPSLVWFGPRASGYVRVLAGGVDVDGDGRDDLIAASTDWGVGGGVAVVRGRPAGVGTEVVCDALVLEGHDRFDRFGISATGLGDLDGDGCDEIAVGATGEELLRDFYNQGTVRVLWGWGGPGCPAQPEVSTLLVQVVGTGLGSALAGGRDVDGDGVPDLVVGGATHRVHFAEMGAVWLVPGSHVRTATRQPLDDGALPAPEDTSWTLLLPEQGLPARHGLVGDTAGGLFGEAVALVDDPDDPNGVLVAVGMPQGSEGDVPRGGGVRLYRFDRDGAGFDPVPWAVVAGETAGPGALGGVLHAGRLGDASTLLVGAPDSHAGGLALGAVYPVRWAR